MQGGHQGAHAHQSEGVPEQRPLRDFGECSLISALDLGPPGKLRKAYIRLDRSGGPGSEKAVTHEGSGSAARRQHNAIPGSEIFQDITMRQTDLLWSTADEGQRGAYSATW